MKNALFLAGAAVLAVAGCCLIPQTDSSAPRRLLTLTLGKDRPRHGEGDLIRLADNSILFIYTEYVGTSAQDNATAHLVARRSADGGETWTEPQEVFPREGKMNDMSVSLLRLRDGRLALFNLRKNSETDCIPVVRFSSDEGKIWSAPTDCLPAAAKDYYVLNNARACQLKSGRLVLPLAKHSKSDKTGWAAGMLSCALSDDGGKTWRKGNEYAVTDATGARVVVQEPGVLPLKDGRLYLYARTDRGRQWQAFSKDNGQTWTDFGPSSLFGPCGPATLRRLPDGRILAIWNDHEGHPEYNDRPGWGRVPLTIAYSSDEGQTWTDRRVIEPDLDGFFCYFATLIDGRDLLLHYYCRKWLSESCVTRVPEVLPAQMTFDPKTFSVNAPHAKDTCTVTYGEHDFGGEVRPAICLELKWREKGRADVTIDLGGIDMLDAYPTIDFLVACEGTCTADGQYFGNVHIWDSMNEKFKFEDGVCRIRREIGHKPRWASWMNVREVRNMRVSVNYGDEKNKEKPVRFWVSDIRFSSADEWKATKRDAEYRAWLKFCDTYEPDLSDSSACLEPPKEGRLAKPLKLVENHVAKAEIVAPKDFYNTLELAARDLQVWIEKMTGAKLPIVEKPTGTMPVRVFLNDPAAQKRWADDVEWLKGGKDIDGWFVHTDGNDIYIGCAVPNDAKWTDMADLGLPFDACPIGAYRGAIAFLENNSTILFACNDKNLGTVYDETPDFTVRWGEGRSRPSTNGRGWLVGNDTSNRNKIAFDSLCMWCARTGGNVRMPHRISGHGNQSGEMIEYVPNKEPYQVWDGEKRLKHGYYTGQICFGAPDCLEVAVSNGIRKTERSFDAGYPVASIGFWNEDNWRVCICSNCTRAIEGDDGTVLTSSGKTNKDKMAGDEQLYRSTQYMRFANELADGVAAKYPGVKTEVLAYIFQRPTPKCAISPNIAWTYCPYLYRGYSTPIYHPLNGHVYDNVTSMLEKGGEMHVYDYHAFGGITDPASAIPEVAAEDYRWYTDHGAKLIGSECAYISNTNAPAGMFNGWLFNKVGWDADITKVEGLRKYYLRRLYREGAPAAEDYYARFRRARIRSRGPKDPAPKMLTGDEAKEVFGRYLDKITNPIAKKHYEILMKKAIDGK